MLDAKRNRSGWLLFSLIIGYAEHQREAKNESSVFGVIIFHGFRSVINRVFATTKQKEINGDKI